MTPHLIQRFRGDGEISTRTTLAAAHRAGDTNAPCGRNHHTPGEEKNRGTDKLIRKDRDLLVPASKIPYILSFATDGSRLLQIGNAPVCRLLQTLFAYYRQSLVICIYVYTYIHMRIYIHIYKNIYIYV